MMLRRLCAVQVVAALIGLAPAHADPGYQARVLPFWAQPYPSGYTAPAGFEATHRPYRIHHLRRRAIPRCRCR